MTTASQHLSDYGCYLPTSFPVSSECRHLERSFSISRHWRKIGQGNRSDFQIKDGILEGGERVPFGPIAIERGGIQNDWTDCDVGCWINVVSPNLRYAPKAH